jgi:hypothetical protein
MEEDDNNIARFVPGARQSLNLVDIIIDLMRILVDINEQSYDIFPKKLTSSDNIYL